MNSRADHPLVGRWRIESSDLWSRDHLDICGPAMLTITARGHGQIDFGALTACLDIDYGSDELGFTWNGADEGDQVRGEGSAELRPDGSIHIEFAYENGDEAVLIAKRDSSSTAC